MTDNQFQALSKIKILWTHLIQNKNILNLIQEFDFVNFTKMIEFVLISY